MPPKADSEKTQLIARVNYYREMGIYDFYRRPSAEAASIREAAPASAARTGEGECGVGAGSDASLFDSPTPVVQDKAAALKAIREDIDDCTRCRLHKGRKNIVFGVGNVNADIMFVGEGPGADEDEQGEPFVGRAGQLLSNMISPMGSRP